MRRQQRLGQVRELAAQAAREEVRLATQTASCRASFGTTGQSSDRADLDQPFLTARGRPHQETERSSSSSSSSRHRGPQESWQSTPSQRDQAEQQAARTSERALSSSVVERRPHQESHLEGERSRVCFDVLILMATENLRAGLRMEGLMLTGLKEDQARRLSRSLEGTSHTEARDRPSTRQLQYILWLWRQKKLQGRCRLTWHTLQRKDLVSEWIAAWKDA